MAISISPHADLGGFARGWRLWLGICVASTALAASVFWASRTTLLYARRIEVLGASYLSRAAVVELAGVSLATNVLWLDEEAAERRLEQNAWVAEADVSVSLPWTIRITIAERVPVAVASNGLTSMLVAGDGTFLGAGGSGLPTILVPPARVAVGAPSLAGTAPSPAGAARALGAMAPEARALVRRVTVGLDGTLKLRMDGGLLVEFGQATDLSVKARALARIVSWVARTGEIVRAVNLAAPSSPTLSLGR